MRLPSWFTRRRSGPADMVTTGEAVRFSQVAPEGAVVPFRPNGLPSPNSAFAERVREFFAAHEAEGDSIRSSAERAGRLPKRFYHESDGTAPLSLDFVDTRGAQLSLRNRLILARFLMDRWGLRAEVGRLPGLEER